MLLKRVTFKLTSCFVLHRQSTDLLNLHRWKVKPYQAVRPGLAKSQEQMNAITNIMAGKTVHIYVLTCALQLFAWSSASSQQESYIHSKPEGPFSLVLNVLCLQYFLKKIVHFSKMFVHFFSNTQCGLVTLKFRSECC